MFFSFVRGRRGSGPGQAVTLASSLAQSGMRLGVLGGDLCAVYWRMPEQRSWRTCSR